MSVLPPGATTPDFWRRLRARASAGTCWHVAR